MTIGAIDPEQRRVAERLVLAALRRFHREQPLSVDLGYAGVPFLFATTLERAVSEAASAARPADVVLLSPACASYDQFRDYEHRGEDFRRLVQNLQA